MEKMKVKETLNIRNIDTPDNICMEALQLAGKIIMENGGETYRAEETVKMMGAGFGLDEVDSFAVPSGLFISFLGHDGKPVTGIRRVRCHDRNLFRVNEANQVSREVFSGTLDCQRAYKRLREIEKLPGDFSGWWSFPAAFLCGAGFSMLFGGNAISVVCAGTVASFVQMLEKAMRRFRSHGLAASVLGGLLTTLLPHLIGMFMAEVQTEIVIASAMMPLVPGLAMTNAVQDTMRGDMLSGLSHGTQALLTACLIAGGALLALAVLKLITGGLN